jgi:prolyl-tRNA synthetase
MDAYYNETIEAYKRVYDRLGIGEDTYMTFASGGAFTQFSHEFQTICDAGEDVIYLHRGKNIAVNEEVIDEAVKELDISRDELEKVKTAEVGNIFNFGSQKTDVIGLTFTDTNGQKSPIFMGSYGIGITRAMGVIVEKYADDAGIVWPEAVAPFRVYLATIGDVSEQADKLYKELTDSGIDVLYDDRDVRPGEKFADADLIGIPHRIVLSPKLVEQGSFEYKARTQSEAEILTHDTLFAKIGAAE